MYIYYGNILYFLFIFSFFHLIHPQLPIVTVPLFSPSSLENICLNFIVKKNAKSLLKNDTYYEHLSKVYDPPILDDPQDVCNKPWCCICSKSQLPINLAQTIIKAASVLWTCDLYQPSAYLVARLLGHDVATYHVAKEEIEEIESIVQVIASQSKNDSLRRALKNRINNNLTLLKKFDILLATHCGLLSQEEKQFFSNQLTSFEHAALETNKISTEELHLYLQTNFLQISNSYRDERNRWVEFTDNINTKKLNYAHFWLNTGLKNSFYETNESNERQSWARKWLHDKKVEEVIEFILPFLDPKDLWNYIKDFSQNTIQSKHVHRLIGTIGVMDIVPTYYLHQLTGQLMHTIDEEMKKKSSTFNNLIIFIKPLTKKLKQHSFSTFPHSLAVSLALTHPLASKTNLDFIPLEDYDDIIQWLLIYSDTYLTQSYQHNLRPISHIESLIKTAKKRSFEETQESVESFLSSKNAITNIRIQKALKFPDHILMWQGCSAINGWYLLRAVCQKNPTFLAYASDEILYEVLQKLSAVNAFAIHYTEPQKTDALACVNDLIAILNQERELRKKERIKIFDSGKSSQTYYFPVNNDVPTSDKNSSFFNRWLTGKWCM